MPFLLGAISGVLLTVLAVFAAVTTAADPSKDPQQRIVNWDVAAARLSETTQAIREGANDLRQGVHELTR